MKRSSGSGFTVIEVDGDGRVRKVVNATRSEIDRQTLCPAPGPRIQRTIRLKTGRPVVPPAKTYRCPADDQSN